ncbi:Heavy metal-associated isoprenylated plant protein 2 [Sesamum angolense]|uniref:Heavy metal-associated isoprenylated plant protein 2 n=1 Tax=Sesamum angolense TaxID=2727404 RepID=A0AAE1WZ52_9LAMI|nr:Heavy metal-associated isoprenylated plant protein 2 [Sesamum angolense]
MSAKKIELKVGIYCEKCKTRVLKAVAKLKGVDEITVNAEKGILTVVGTVDPVCVTTQVRKAGNYAEITSVGPPKKPETPKPKPPETEKPKPVQPLPPCCDQCQLVAFFWFYVALFGLFPSTCLCVFLLICHVL